MPIPNLPSEVTAPLARLRALSGTATTFASDMVSLLGALLDPARGPLGTAALRDTGTDEGNVPLLDSTGKIPSALVPEATAEARGAVTLARTLEDTRAGVVPTAAQISMLTAAASTGLSAANFTITPMADGVDFTTPAQGLIIVSGAGGGGHTPPASGEYLSGGHGTGTISSFLFFGPVRTQSSPNNIRVRGGLGGGSAPNVETPIRIPVYDATVDGAPDFAVTIKDKGSPGGDPGAFDPTATTGNDAVVGLPGEPGDLLIAKVPAGKTYRANLASGGAGAAARPATSSQRSVAGRQGGDAFAFYVRLV